MAINAIQKIKATMCLLISHLEHHDGFVKLTSVYLASQVVQPARNVGNYKVCNKNMCWNCESKHR